MQAPGESDERHASWLGLFFDLVFVVAVAELAQELARDHSLGGFAIFAGLFLPVFIAWAGLHVLRRSLRQRRRPLSRGDARRDAGHRRAGRAHPRMSPPAATTRGSRSIRPTWWVYFDRGMAGGLSSRTGSMQIHPRIHIPLLAALTAVGAGVHMLIQEAATGEALELAQQA
jgi:low temperature requirement protein LtrA